MRLHFHIARLRRPMIRGIMTLNGLLFVLNAPDLYAQVGDNNPGGVSGIFNGQVNTGCSYDPWTGNAMRSITDIVVSGAVGEYPLALVRTANSRTPSTTGVFGWHGGWNHNYNWIMEDSATSTTQNFQPSAYTVDFPDGRVGTFNSVTWDTSCYRVRTTGGGNTSSAGLRERIQPLNISTMLVYLILPDGGKIEFAAQQHYNGTYYYQYHVTAIIDPYGLRTTIDSEVVGTAQRRRTTRVTEPVGGRYLQFSYQASTSPQITQIQEYINGAARRSVQYLYTNGWLSGVVYYSQWTASYQYTLSNTDPDLPLLLWTCDDPMYPGPMKRIAYAYKTGSNPDGTAAAYGQMLTERYWDGTSGHEGSGAVVSTLTVGAAPSNHNIRTETRGDNKMRTFSYSTDGYLTSCTDFYARSASQTYDAKNYINSVTDRNSHRTDYSMDALTGSVTLVTVPLTPSDTIPQQTMRSTASYTYGWAGCADTNNRDANNPYFVCTAKDEAGNVVQFWRDANHRVTNIDYPDGGYETFSYNGFGEMLTHQRVTGGVDTYTYDGRGLIQTYLDSTNFSGNPNGRYGYDVYDRVSDITDVFGANLGDANHTSSFTYNLRGQVLTTTLAKDPVDNLRHAITNVYNPDGTLQSKTDQLNHLTSFTYDDYRRLKSVTPPVRGGTDTSPHVTTFYYDASGVGNDYKFTDSNVTWIALPSGKKAKNVYDDNRRESTVTVGYGSGADATTSYGYDYVGNLTSVLVPNQQSGQQYSGKSTQISYDERNRPWQITDALNNTITLAYDTVGHKKMITRPNGQTITYDLFDEMNRVKQQTVAQSPNAAATTKYVYYRSTDGPNAPVGLLKTMQDPHLVEMPNNTDTYTYTYDGMGRKTSVTYPADSGGNHRTESFYYDGAGRLWLYTNRAGDFQSFGYDALHRMTGFTWNDRTTPSVALGYDAGSRLTSITNTDAVSNATIATITRTYYNDNSFSAETEQINGAVSSKTVSYAYDADGNRGSVEYLNDSYSFTYAYTGRNQLQSILSGNSSLATYGYNVNGDLISRSLLPRGTTSYTYDALDRVTHIDQALLGQTRTLDYAYDSVGNRKWTKRDGGTGDTFAYDKADQVTAVKLNIASPDNQPPLRQTIYCDANGNLTSFFPYGTTYNYVTNTLNQYTSRNGTTATYNNNGNLTIGVDGSMYTYDAQNRLVTASKNGTSISFKYDGFNRQVSRTVNGATTYCAWDGWNLAVDYQANGSITAKYLYGADGVVKNLTTGRLYYHDASGSTSHMSDSAANLLEWYRYDLQGTPVIYDANNNQRTSSAYSVRHLFTGQQWYQEIGLYDLRNRFYSPDIGRFLQPDPIGFRGGTNLYRYCRNNPVTRSDPFGLQDAVNQRLDGGGDVADYEPQYVNGESPNTFWREPLGFGGPGGGPGGGGGNGPLDGITFRYGIPPRNSNSNTQQQPPPQNPQAPAIFHPTTTAEFILAGNIIEHGNTMDTTPAIDPIDLLSGGIAALARSFVRTVVARVTTKELSVIRYTHAGESFIRYESGNPAFSRVTATGGVTPGTYAAPASNGVVPLELRASTYNLPTPEILRPDAIMLRSPTGTPIIGPRSVVGGPGDEVIFPFGY